MPKRPRPIARVPAASAPERLAVPFVLLAALSLWTASLLSQGAPAGPGILPTGVRGALLLAAALWTCRLAALKRIPDLLFPLAWLSVSPALREVCAPGALAAWAWTLLGLASLSACLAVRDAGRLQIVVLPILAAMTLLSRSSLYMVLAFLFLAARHPVRRGWFHPRLASLLAAVVVLLLSFVPLRAGIPVGWVEAYDFVAVKRNLSFMLLALLGMSGSWVAPFAKRGFLQFFLAWAGWIIWVPSGGCGAFHGAMGVTFILLAGVGLRTLKEEVLDDSWHARIVWAGLGLLLFAALFLGFAPSGTPPA
jgi:hypothetical protein